MNSKQKDFVGVAEAYLMTQRVNPVTALTHWVDAAHELVAVNCNAEVELFEAAGVNRRRVVIPVPLRMFLESTKKGTSCIWQSGSKTLGVVRFLARNNNHLLSVWLDRSVSVNAVDWFTRLVALDEFDSAACSLGTFKSIIERSSDLDCMTGSIQFIAWGTFVSRAALAQNRNALQYLNQSDRVEEVPDGRWAFTTLDPELDQPSRRTPYLNDLLGPAQRPSDLTGRMSAVVNGGPVDTKSREDLLYSLRRLRGVDRSNLPSVSESIHIRADMDITAVTRILELLRPATAQIAKFSKGWISAYIKWSPDILACARRISLETKWPTIVVQTRKLGNVPQLDTGVLFVDGGEVDRLTVEHVGSRISDADDQSLKGSYVSNDLNGDLQKWVEVLGGVTQNGIAKRLTSVNRFDVLTCVLGCFIPKQCLAHEFGSYELSIVPGVVTVWDGEGG